MIDWSLLGLSLTLVIMTIVTRGLQWYERSQYQCIVDGYELTPQRVPNTYRRNCRRLAFGATVFTLLFMPVNDWSLGLSMGINLIVALLVLLYWQHQPRRLTVYRLPYRPRARA